MSAGKPGIRAVIGAAPKLAVFALAQDHAAAAFRTDRFDNLTVPVLTDPEFPLRDQDAAALRTAFLRMVAERILIAAIKQAVLAFPGDHIAGFAALAGYIGQLFLKTAALKLIGQDRVLVIDQLADKT